jgi:DMSO/TMAO reductase YedYZ molybdopterin-dependent catalytic subunit
MTMNTAKLAGHGGVMAVIAPHATGHAWAKDSTLLRVDFERGIGWVATHYDLNLRVINEVRGSDEEVHRTAARWARGQEKP